MKTTILLTCFFLFFNSAKASEAPSIQLANLYHKGIELADYLVSEKLDGVRARWDGKKLISRQDNEIKAPQWFTKDFPKDELDGELWLARGKFEETCAIVLDENPQEKGWSKITFMVFDMPKFSGSFSARYSAIQKLHETRFLKIIKQTQFHSHQELMKHLEFINQSGGEGLMLHKKNSLYQAARNDDLLKLKSFEDAEATVIDYIGGKGRLEGQMGALLVETPEGIRFKIGTGFSDEQRKSPPKIGRKITYKFYGKTKKHKPRFPVFMRERPDNS